MRDSFIFYRSFFEAAQSLSKADKARLFDAIIDYGLNSKTPDLKGAVNGMFKLIKPQLDANIKRYENGKKGGRPKTEETEKQNQDETKTKPKQNQNETKTKANNNVNVNVNDNYNLKENLKENGAGYIPPKPF